MFQSLWIKTVPVCPSLYVTVFLSSWVKHFNVAAGSCFLSISLVPPCTEKIVFLKMFSGILETPSVDKKKAGKDALPLTIICDNIRDPGNLGTILRAAAGVGCQKVILTKGLFITD